MFWAFKLRIVADILAFFDLATFWAVFLKKKAKMSSNLLVTLETTNKINILMLPIYNLIAHANHRDCSIHIEREYMVD
jgi:hypothetical protein